MKSRAVLYFILINLLCFGVYGQQKVSATKLFDVADGLPQSYVSGLVQDRQGFVWIATRDGLAKYDGRTFKTFRHIPGDDSSLSSSVITTLYLDNNDRLWINYEQGDVDLMDTRTLKLRHFFKNTPRDVGKNKIRNGLAVAQDHLKNYWIMAYNRDGVYITDESLKLLKFYTHKQLLPDVPDSYIMGIAAYKKLIVLVTNKALIFMDSSRQIVKKVPYSFNNNLQFEREKISEDNSPTVLANGDILIPDEQYVVFYSAAAESFSVIKMPPLDYHIFHPRIKVNNGKVLYAYGSSLYEWEKDRFRLWAGNTGKEKHKVVSLLLDRSGVLWAGTDGYGLFQYDMRLKRMPKYDYKYIFHKDITERLGVGIDKINSSFLGRIHSYHWRWAKSPDGTIWMSRASDSLTAFPNICSVKDGVLANGKWTYTNSKVAEPGINSIASSASGKIWGINHNYCLVSFDIKNQKLTLSKPVINEASNIVNQVNGLVIDEEHIFWISSPFGLTRYNSRTGKSTNLKSSLPGAHPLTLRQDPLKKEILWIGSNASGLIRFDKVTLKATHYTTRDGLPNNTIYGIIPDNQGNLWCSSNKGIFSFNPATGAVRSYTTRDGLPVDEFNRSYFMEMPDGTIAFGGTNGYTVFNPKDLSGDNYAPQTALTSIRINNTQPAPGSALALLDNQINNITRIKLRYDQNFLSFEFAGLEFNIPEKLHYRYRLKGIDKSWVLSGTDNRATYTSIPPGEYTFLANTANTMGVWSNQVKQISIIITPPFWKTWWFLTICFLLISGIIYFAIRQRLINIRKKDQQKIALQREAMELEAQALRSQMNPHFVFNCLNSIKALIQGEQKRTAVLYLTTFSKLIRSHLNSNQMQTSLYEELETCRMYLELESLRFGDKISYEFIIDKNTDTHSLMVPPLIIQPFIENAILHGILPRESGGEITITVKQQNEKVTCIIDDNGIGRRNARKSPLYAGEEHTSKGTLLVQNRLELHKLLHSHGGDVVILDKKDEEDNPLGTRVILTFTLHYD